MYREEFLGILILLSLQCGKAKICRNTLCIYNL